MNFRDEAVLAAFAKHFQKVRVSRNFTQEELAFQSEISLSQIARIETARINPTLCTLVALAKALGVHPQQTFRILMAGQL